MSASRVACALLLGLALSAALARLDHPAFAGSGPPVPTAAVASDGPDILTVPDGAFARVPTRVEYTFSPTSQLITMPPDGAGPGFKGARNFTQTLFLPLVLKYE